VNAAKEVGDHREPLVAHLLDPAERAAAIEKFAEAVKAAGPRFGEAVRTLQDSATGASPIETMGTMALYIGSAEAGSNPEHNRPFGLFQHHLELAQAVLLRYGTPTDGQLLAEHFLPIAAAVKEFNEAWLLLQAQKVDRATPANRSLQEATMRLRINSSTRRGWGYRSRMVPMLRDLFAPLDDLFLQEVGFSLGAFPDWWEAIFDRVDERLDVHRKLVAEALEWDVDEEWEQRIGERFGHLEADPQELAKIKAADEKSRRGYVIHCSDLKAHEIYRFSLDELVELMPASTSPEVVERIIDTWSMGLGDSGGVDIGALVTDNPS
jgi:hypothetical protein